MTFTKKHYAVLKDIYKNKYASYEACLSCSKQANKEYYIKELSHEGYLECSLYGVSFSSISVNSRTPRRFPVPPQPKRLHTLSITPKGLAKMEEYKSSHILLGMSWKELITVGVGVATLAYSLFSN